MGGQKGWLEERKDEEEGAAGRRDGWRERSGGRMDGGWCCPERHGAAVLSYLAVVTAVTRRLGCPPCPWLPFPLTDQFLQHDTAWGTEEGDTTRGTVQGRVPNCGVEGAQCWAVGSILGRARSCSPSAMISLLPQPFLLPLSPWHPAGQGQAAGKAGKEGWSKQASRLVLLWGSAACKAAQLPGELPKVLVLLLCAFQYGNMYPSPAPLPG